MGRDKNTNGSLTDITSPPAELASMNKTTPNHGQRKISPSSPLHAPVFNFSSQTTPTGGDECDMNGDITSQHKLQTNFGARFRPRSQTLIPESVLPSQMKDRKIEALALEVPKTVDDETPLHSPYRSKSLTGELTYTAFWVEKGGDVEGVRRRTTPPTLSTPLLSDSYAKDDFVARNGSLKITADGKAQPTTSVVKQKLFRKAPKPVASESNLHNFQ